MHRYLAGQDSVIDYTVSYTGEHVYLSNLIATGASYAIIRYGDADNYVFHNDTQDPAISLRNLVPFQPQEIRTVSILLLIPL